MRLDELKQSISDMSTEDLMETFRKIRHARANPPAKQETKTGKSKSKSRSKSQTPTRKSVLSDINDMSPDQLDALIKQLGG